MTGPQKFRWYQFRLWFLAIVIPLSGLALGLPWAEIQRHEHDAEFMRRLSGWKPHQSNPGEMNLFVEKLIARKVSISDLPVPVLRSCYVDGDLAFLYAMDREILFKSYVLRLTKARRIVGRSLFTANGKQGCPPSLLPRIWPPETSS